MEKYKILVVDDSPTIVFLVESRLQANGYQTISALDGEEALETIRSKPLDLVLLDYKMPKMDGLQVCDLIKKDLLLAHLPIIMVTGKGEISDKIDGINSGADDYIVKPFTADNY